MPELKKGITSEEFQALMGETFKVLKGPYAGKQGVLLGCMEGDNELALRCGDEILFPFIDEIDPNPFYNEPNFRTIGKR
tara:strand:- start:10763 stop:10999 length:237 start_codon:yes stop_codon:yes gene_type:complete